MSLADKVVVVVLTLGGHSVVFIPARQQCLHLMVSLSRCAFRWVLPVYQYC